ncbi:RES family NAD+ phosphorylase [Sporosarcina sp. YIM B06819]|uniref:RES family NAD+ phosphorylase n=1 Tax=Sporosarcina sp. YIM B06819 TaxID=3081769 RepID=UPI00298BCAC8|nr:RES family NAD+ phosphorylase [Sporosarcina sp. YIM B06819]
MEIDGYGFNVNLITEQWMNVKEDLYHGKVNYTELEKLVKDYMFFNRFDNVLKESLKNFEIPLKNITPLYRGVREEVLLDDYGRMVPTLKYATGNNRMNPPGKTYIYLGVLGENKGRGKKTVKSHIIRTIIKETRSPKDSIITICEFQVSELGENKTVINFCGDSNIPQSEKELYNYIRKQISQGKGKESELQVISTILSNIYFNMVSSDQIFKPIETYIQEVKKYEYAPFHALAHYISEQGYAGIIFKSTVHKNGTNLVLFDTEDVLVATNSMEHIKTSDYI